MTFEEFRETVLTELPELIPDAEISILPVKKLQGQSYTGIAIRPKESNVGVTLSLDDFHLSLENGLPVEHVLEEIVSAYDTLTMELPDIRAPDLTDYSVMAQHLRLELIPTAGNAEILSGVPHRSYFDLSVVYRLDLSKSGADGRQTTLVTDEMLRAFGVTEEQLYQDACIMGTLNYPCKICSMAEVLAELLGTDILTDEADAGMWYASTPDGYLGASVLLYPGFTEQAAEKLGGSYFVLPSSIHEILLIPDSGIIRAPDLDRMIRDINEHDVLPQDRLSDRSLHYDARTRALEYSEDYESRRAAERGTALSARAHRSCER